MMRKTIHNILKILGGAYSAKTANKIERERYYSLRRVMDITLRLCADFESVFLVNGKLVEGGDIVYGDSEVVYITALPLSALLLPYTVKLVGSNVKTNPELCKCYQLGTGQFHLRLLPRHNYVYSVTPATPYEPKGIVERLFSLVLDKKVDEARAGLSRELSESIDDQSLLDFFADYVDIVQGGGEGEYYLIGKDGTGVLYRFVIVGSVVDNIIEM